MNAGAYILQFAAHATMGVWCIFYWTKPKTYGDAILAVVLGTFLGFFALAITIVVKIIDSRFWAQPLPTVKGTQDGHDDFEPLNSPNNKRDC